MTDVVWLRVSESCRKQILFRSIDRLSSFWRGVQIAGFAVSD